MLIDLSHRITDGMLTYPGLPAPVIGTHLSREAAEEIYGPGITFHIGLLTICTNTGTYIDVPFHRYADGHDLGSRTRAGDGSTGRALRPPRPRGDHADG
jgi:arylformamidase